ncbi:MAG TPA: hypothetical protein PLQ80_09345 [Candidatus Syntrophosphaera sp.]|nr:hypothetical protein [Candidatus Syntrophosphaera sp.]
MNYVYIGLFAVFGIAIAALYYLLFREIRDNRESARHYHSQSSRPSHSVAYPSDVGKIPNIIWRLDDLQRQVDNLTEAKDRGRGGGMGVQNSWHKERISEPEPQIKQADPPQPAPRHEEPRDDRIWARKTNEGNMRLEETEGPTELYLQKLGGRFLLHFQNLNPGNLANMMMLYGDILGFPAGFDTASRVSLDQPPEYERQGAHYVFKRKGKVSVTP